MNPYPLCPPAALYAILLAGVEPRPTPSTEKPTGSESEAGPFQCGRAVQ